MPGESCAPIENSPPGIHTMPSGGAAAGFVVFITAGLNAELAAGKAIATAFSFRCADANIHQTATTIIRSRRPAMKYCATEIFARPRGPDAGTLLADDLLTRFRLDTESPND